MSIYVVFHAECLAEKQLQTTPTRYSFGLLVIYVNSGECGAEKSFLPLFIPCCKFNSCIPFYQIDYIASNFGKGIPMINVTKLNCSIFLELCLPI